MTQKLKRYAIIALFLIGFNSMYLANSFATLAQAAYPGTAVPPAPGTVIPPGPGTVIPPGPGTVVPPGPGTTIPNPLNSKFSNICNLINEIINIIAEIGAIVAVLFIIWSGFLFIAAQGNKEKVTQAKNTFYTTIIGTAILLGASVITKIIFNTVTSITARVSDGGGICPGHPFGS